jgi:hypothetical protein
MQMVYGLHSGTPPRANRLIVSPSGQGTSTVVQLIAFEEHYSVGALSDSAVSSLVF